MSEPLCKAILLCQYYSQDRVSSMFTLAGVYCRILTKKVPKEQPNIIVFVKISDMNRGDNLVQVAILDPDGKEVAAEDDPYGRLEVPSSLTEYSTVVIFGPVKLEKFGRYMVEARVNGATVGITKLAVEQLPEEEPLGDA